MTSEEEWSLGIGESSSDGDSVVVCPSPVIVPRQDPLRFSRATAKKIEHLPWVLGSKEDRDFRDQYLAQHSLTPPPCLSKSSQDAPVQSSLVVHPLLLHLEAPSLSVPIFALAFDMLKAWVAKKSSGHAEHAFVTHFLNPSSPWSPSSKKVARPASALRHPCFFLKSCIMVQHYSEGSCGAGGRTSRCSQNSCLMYLERCVFSELLVVLVFWCW